MRREELCMINVRIQSLNAAQRFPHSRSNPLIFPRYEENHEMKLANKHLYRHPTVRNVTKSAELVKSAETQPLFSST